MNKWREVRLGEVVENTQYGFTTSSTEEPTGIKFLRITDIVDYFIDWKSVPYCKIDENSLKKYRIYEDDLLIARTGATAGVYKVIDSKFYKNTVFASYLIRFKLNKKLVNPLYIKYCLGTKLYKQFIQNYISGSAQPNINAKILSKFKFNLPDLETQEKIANVLSSYDNLIENNNRRIELLENMAEEIYKEWFVRMRFPGYEKTKFEKGIPEGWEVKNFINNDVSLISSGIDEFHGTKTYLATADVDDINIVGGEKITYKGKPSRANMQPIKDSIWFAKMQDTIKHIYFNKFSDNEIKRIVLSTGFAGIKFKNINHYYYYYLSFIRYGVFENIKDMYANGSTQVAINNQNIKRLKIIIPTEYLLLEFGSKLEDIYFIIKKYKEQNENLMKQRDMLLPRLMNGSVEVK